MSELRSLAAQAPLVVLATPVMDARQEWQIASLTAAMARGDEAAWREFESRYFSRLLRYLFIATGGDLEAAQEAMQLTLLRVVRHIKVMEREEVLWSWLTVLARSCVVDERRKRSRYFGLLDRFFRRQDPAATAAESAPADLAALLEDCLIELPAEERALLERKYFARQPVKVIAAEIDSTEKAVESRLGRIRRKLHDAILTRLKHESTH